MASTDAEMADNQHHDYVNQATVRLTLLAALDHWEKGNCDCCAPTVLDDGIDEIGYEVALWERFRKFGIELAQTAQNVIDGESVEPPSPSVAEEV